MDVTEEQILEMVKRFYGTARADDQLGPLFNAVVSDWDTHFLTVAGFWSRVLLGTNRYKAHPFAAHLDLPIKLEHFDRWLKLFTVAAESTLPVEAANKVKSRAAHMIESFRVGLFPFTDADGKPSRIPPKMH